MLSNICVHEKYILALIQLAWIFFNRLDVEVTDVGTPADWVKINVQKTVSYCMNLFPVIGQH